MLGSLLMALAPLRPIEVLDQRTLHYPRETPRGTVLCVHSIFQNAEESWVVAQAMARAGFLAENVRLPEGLSFSQYIDFVDQIADRSTGPVYLWGHSMGADLAAASRSRKVRAIVTVGFPTQGNHQLALVGAWDQLHGVADFQSPVALLLLADHSGENFDIQGFRQASAHFGGLDPGWADPYWGRALLALGVLLLGRSRTKGGTRPRVLAVAGASAALWWSDPFHTLSRALVGGLILANGQAQGMSRAQVMGMGLALATAQILTALPNLVTQPWLLLVAPLALFSWIPLAWMKLSGSLTPPFLAMLLGLELFAPGRVLEAILFLPHRVWRSAATLQWRPPQWGQNRLHLALLLALLATAGLQWRQVAAAGYAPDPREWLLIGIRLTTLIVAPTLVYMGVARRMSLRSK